MCTKTFKDVQYAKLCPKAAKYFRKHSNTFKYVQSRQKHAKKNQISSIMFEDDQKQSNNVQICSKIVKIIQKRIAKFENDHKR